MAATATLAQHGGPATVDSSNNQGPMDAATTSPTEPKARKACSEQPLALPLPPLPAQRGPDRPGPCWVPQTFLGQPQVTRRLDRGEEDDLGPLG